MALTIAIEGTGVVANCDAITDTAGGGWAELGGGSISDEADAFIYGTTSIGNKYASKSGWTYINKTTALDFDTGGAQEGELLYIWLNIAAPNAFDTIANNGFAIRLGSTTTIYREWTIAGEDDANGWSGGWKLFVLDPTTAGTNDNGTYDPGNVDLIGVWINTNTSVRADSIFIDQIACGTGLRITGTWNDGTYDNAWDEVLAYCTDYSNRAWGMLQERDGVLYGFGKFYIGDSSQSADTVFENEGKIFQFGTSQYWSGTAWVSTMPTDACGIIIEDHASYTTDFIDGVIVGTENGRSGSTYVGNDDQNIIMDLYGGNNVASEVLCYGTTFKDIAGAFNSGNDAGHKFLSCSFLKCSQFDPVGAPMIRNCIFAETIDVDAALLWNENINIQKCNFIANTLGAAIEMPSAAGTPYTYTALFFSGNTKDVLNSSGSTIAINKASLSDPSSSEGSTVNFQASSTLYFLVQDEDNTPIQTAYVYINDDDSGSAELNDTTDVNGEVSDSYSGAVSTAALRVRKYGYKPFKDTIDISANVSRTITLIADPQQT